MQENIFEKPTEFWNLDKLLTSYGVDRRASLKEIMMKIFLKDYKLKTREDLANDYFQKFISEVQFDNSKYNPAKRLFDSYLLYEDIREKINSNSPDPNDARFGLREMKELGKDNRIQIVNYIKDNISINQFLPR